jgi:ketosteroid isomerase-like protein
MAADELTIAHRFQQALEGAVQSGDLDEVYPLLAHDVEWVTSKRTLSGIDEVREQLTWISPADQFAVEFTAETWVDHGDGRLVCRVHEIYRLENTGETAYERDRQVELTIEDGRISRYELRTVGG